MEVGMIGLGRMGANMAERLARGGHRVVCFDRDSKAVQRTLQTNSNIVGSASPEDLLTKLRSPRVVWLMIPSGDPVEAAIHTLADLMAAGDIIVDGGNSFFRDSVRRAAILQPKEIRFVDVGTSGGIWGLAEGYCLMIGGDQAVAEHLRPIFETLAPAADRGWSWVGPSGAGHFVKMVHNGIEYGLMQAYAEGFALLEKADYEFDLARIAELWRHGSVVRSWLLDLTAEGLASNPDLKGIRPYVADSGEGRWMVAESIAANVAVPVITISLLERIKSRDPEAFGNKVLAMMRNKFGGHEIKTE